MFILSKKFCHGQVVVFKRDFCFNFSLWGLNYLNKLKTFHSALHLIIFDEIHGCATIESCCFSLNKQSKINKV